MAQEVPSQTALETRRLAALAAYEVLDTPVEAAFDEVAALASRICETPIAVVNLIGEGRQFFKAEVGLGVRETPLESSFCAKAILENEFLIVPDATQDSRFDCNPLVTAEGGLRFYAGALLKTGDGLPIGTLCVLDTRPRDLTPLQQDTLKVLARQVMAQLDLRLALRVQREDEARHIAILDSATDYGIIATYLDGMVTRWNVGAQTIMGWSEAEMLGNPIDRIFTPEDRAVERAQHEMRMALEVGRGNDERWHLRKDGARFWAQGEMTPLRRADGTVAGFVKVLRDRTVERLREQRLDLLARASAGLLSSGDPESVLQDILSSGANVLGYEQGYSYLVDEGCTRMQLLRSTGVSSDIADWLADTSVADVPLCGAVALQRESLIIEDVQHSTDPRTAVSQSQGVRAYAGFPILAGDRLYGVISFISVSCDRFENEAIAFFENFARFLSIGRERLDREAALSDLAMTLERRVEERTRELMASEEALRQSQKMDAVGQLTGGVAHDFNNLLTVIRGSIDLLRRDNLPAPRRERYMQAISDTADRAAKLTGQLLAFSRRQTLNPVAFDVGERLRLITDMLNSVTGGRVVIGLDFPEKPCFVRADISQFETALVNIAVNARDAMDGSGRLTIKVVSHTGLPSIRGHAASHEPFIAVSLTDTGSGIAPDVMNRVFEPFFTTKGVGKGTGLGLSQVIGFAKQSGGDIDVASTVGAGTTFTLYLPEAAPGTDSEPATLSHGLAIKPQLRILIVEDNAEVGQFSNEALQDMGYRTTLVPSAEEALEQLNIEGARYDAVFSDVVMPGIGGLELAKRLQRSMPDLPVVLASGYSHVLAQEGAHGFELLQKPYSAEQLSRVFQRIVADRN